MITSLRRRTYSRWLPGDNAPAIAVYPLQTVVTLLRTTPLRMKGGDCYPWSDTEDDELERVARRLRCWSWYVRMGLAREWSPWMDRDGDDDV